MQKVTKEEIAKYIKLRAKIEIESVELHIFGKSQRTKKDEYISFAIIKTMILEYV